MDALLRDLRHAVRSLLRTPGTALIIIATIALAIGANTLIFGLVDAVFLSPLPVSEPERLVRVYSTNERDAATAGSFGAHMPSSFPNYEDLRDRNRTLDGLAAYTFAQVGLSHEGRAEPAEAGLVTPEYFDVLGVDAALGRTFRPDEDDRGDAVAVLSYGLWRDRFGADPEVVGRTLPVNGRLYQVIGVAPPGFRGIDQLLPADLWVPAAMAVELLPADFVPFIEHRRGLLFQGVGRLADGVSIEQARADLGAVAEGLSEEHPTWNEDRGVSLLSLPLAAIDPNQRETWVRSGWLLTIVVGLLLLIACGNVANLLLVRAAGRRREMAVRLSLGASRRQLARQLLTESLVLAGAGGALGLTLAALGRDLLWSFRPPLLDDSAIEPSLDPGVLAFAAGLTLLTGLLFGLAPVLLGRRVGLAENLKTGGAGGSVRGGRRVTPGRVLVAAQLALSLVALVGAGLFLRSLGNALETDPGFETERLLTVSMDPAAAGYDLERSRQLFRRAVAEVEALPGVRRAAVAAIAPLGFDGQRRTGPVGAEQPPEEAGILIGTRAVGVGYFETLGIPIEAGRGFGTGDRADTRRVAVINRTLAETFWDGRNAVGRQLRFSGDERPVEVVGVAADAKYQTLGEEARPFIYLPLEQSGVQLATLHAATEGDPEPLLGSVRGRLEELDPAVPLTDLRTISRTLGDALWGPRTGSVLLGGFAVLALALAALGLYGVLAHSVVRRRREIGIRLALGARRLRVVALIVAQALVVAAVGLALGIFLASLGTRTITGLLYDVSAHDPWTYGTTAALLLVTAVLAALLPARRAARVDPMIAIRED